MSNHGLRKDKTCLNCFHVVDNRFCPNCGQENTETRKSFSHLIAHFAEDFTHYDNAFWTTIKYLLFRPALLTKEYLAGKRQRFVPPVKLYIFVSFVTFFLLSVLPNSSDSESKPKFEKEIGHAMQAEAKEKKEILKKAKAYTPNEESKKVIDSIIKKEDPNDDLDFGRFESVAAYDSVQKLKPAAKRNGTVVAWIKRKAIETRIKAKEKGFKDKFMESLFHNIPKALFLYMPFFAFGLWIFHGKKRWYYFDHGIFTLHYFSFLLFTFSVSAIVRSLTEGFDNTFVNFIDGLLNFGLPCWWFFYFFRSHRKFYGESRLVSRLKSLALFFINMLFIFIFLMVLMMISALNVH